MSENYRMSVGGDALEDAVAHVRGVAQILDRFSMVDDLGVCIHDSQMFSMLGDVLEDAVEVIIAGMHGAVEG